MRPDHPRPDGVEADLRLALRAQPTPPPEGADALLRTVHRRTSRRRIRRQAAGATLMLAGVAGAGAVVFTLPPTTVPVASTPESLATAIEPTSPTLTRAATDRTKAPSPATSGAPSSPPTAAESPQPGEPVQPAGVDVKSVTAVRQASFWVLGSGQCPQGTCNVIAHTDDAGETFNFRTAPDPSAPLTTAAPATSPSSTTDLVGPVGPEVDLRYAVNGTDAWGYGGEVWSTHDTGRTWSPIQLPLAADVTNVQAWGDTVWAFGIATADGAPVVFSSPVGEDRWTAADLGLAATDWLTAPVVADGVVGALVTSVDGQQQYVRSRDDGTTWEYVLPPPGCEAPLASSGVADAVWVYCTSADAAVIAVSTDDATTWQEQALPLPGSPLTTMTGIDPMHALVTDAAMLSIVTVRPDATGGVEQVTGPYSADDVWSDLGYTYADFTDPLTGYLITSDGELARSEDGGRAWTRVHLP